MQYLGRGPVGGWVGGVEVGWAGRVAAARAARYSTSTVPNVCMYSAVLPGRGWYSTVPCWVATRAVQ